MSSTASDGWRRVVAATTGAYGGKPPPIASGLVIAGTDGRSMSGVASDVFRYQPVGIHVRETEMIHGVNEHMPVADFSRMIDFYARLMAGAAS